MINRRFINFKTYNAFLAKKNEIPDDAIVFILDKPCIWAHGKLYVCDGPNTADIANDTLTFKNGKNEAVFTVTQNEGTITFTDSDGHTSSATYILKGEYEGTFNEIALIIRNSRLNELKEVAFSGLYKDLEGRPIIPTVDSQLDPNSENPVQNKKVYEELNKKANATDLENYVDSDELTEALRSKLNKLTAGRGIVIDGSRISSSLDTDVYVFVNDLGDASLADPNKIYILETNVGNEYSYSQWRSINNQWVRIGDVSPTVEGFLTKNTADTYYQPIGDYLVSSDLAQYAKNSDVSDISQELNNYALITYVNANFQLAGDYAYESWVNSNFLRKVEVYYLDSGQEGSEEGSTQTDPSSYIRNIIVDSALSRNSTNPVQNAVITLALDNKVDKTDLNGYATKSELRNKADKTALGSFVEVDDLEYYLSLKLDVLTAGRNITINNNVISANVDIDTEVFVFVDELPIINIDDNKIYIKPEDDNGTTIYILWKHLNSGWISLGLLQAEINLSDYIKRSDAIATFAPKGDYATNTVLLKLRLDLEDLFQPKGSYITQIYGDAHYLPKGNYLTSVDISDLLNQASLDNYATNQRVDNLETTIANTYLKILSVYTEDDNFHYTPEDPGLSSGTGNGGGSSHTVINNTYTVTVDPILSSTSTNPVQNKAIKAELDRKANSRDVARDYATKLELSDKADKSQLSDYVTTIDFQNGLRSKQDTLSEGYGISIDSNGEISVTLDTDLFVIVTGDLPTTNINENKIYLQEIEVDGQTTYKEWRRRNNSWVEVGLKDLSIDLSDYLTEALSDAKYLIPENTYLTPSQANNLYQPKGNDYALASEVARDYQERGDYVTLDNLRSALSAVDSTYQKIGDYAYNSAVASALITLLQVIDQKYVLKQDVYNPNNTEFSTTTPTSITVGGLTSDGTSGTGVVIQSNMITLTTSQYEDLVNAGLVLENTYYFTYEPEEEPTNGSWHFGDEFPIILT